MKKIDKLILKLENCLAKDKVKIDDLAVELSKFNFSVNKPKVSTNYILEKCCKFKFKTIKTKF